MVFGGNSQHPDPEDYFTDTRMSFGDHLEDLRIHLWRAIAGFLVGLAIGFVVGKPVEQFITKPVEEQLERFWDNYYENKHLQIKKDLDAGKLDAGPPVPVVLRFRKQELENILGVKKDVKPPLPFQVMPFLQSVFEKLGMDGWVAQQKLDENQWVEVRGQIANMLEIANDLKPYEKIVSKRASLSTMNVQEAFMVYFQVSIVCGLILASPWIFYQIWSFIAAGLYPHEKRHVNLFLPASIGLFAAGVLICEFMAIPRAVEALLWFNQWMGLEPNLRLSEWLSFAILMPLVFGLSFQMPLVMLFAERVGVATVEWYRKSRKYAWFFMALFSAIVNPSSEYASMLWLWLPLCVLYELGILWCVLSPKRPTFDLDVPESEELIEV
jgi:sec-independent protein translocase protein TatC